MKFSLSVALWAWVFQILISVTLQTSESKSDMRQKTSQTYHSKSHIRNKRTHHEEELLYTTSQVFPRQVCVLNSSAMVGVVMDSVGEKVAILNGETGSGVVIDKPLRMGVTINKGGWNMIQQDLKTYLKDCNVSHLMETNSQNSFQIDEQGPQSEVVKLVESNLVYFGEDFFSKIITSTGDLITLAMDLFGFVMHPLKNVLGPVINLFVEGWIIIKGGILALLNIFLWMGKLVAYVAGGFMKLVAKLVRFPLTLIITALDGARAFFYMLKELTINFDLMELLRKILTMPAEIARFIAGLGGELAAGITGVFNLVAHLFDFSNTGIALAVQGFMNVLIRFFGKQRPNYQEVQQSANTLITIADDQEARYKNDFGPYRQFLGSVGGTSDFKVQGVGVGKVVKLLTEQHTTGTNQVMGVMSALQPLMPFGHTLPQLLVGMVKVLNTTNGASYIERIMPSIKIPKESLENVNSNLLGAALRTGNIDHPLDDLKSLPAPELLRKLPIVSSIYAELDKAAQEYNNSTMDELLKNHAVAKELVEVTTEALRLPVR